MIMTERRALPLIKSISINGESAPAHKVYSYIWPVWNLLLPEVMAIKATFAFQCYWLIDWEKINYLTFFIIKIETKYLNTFLVKKGVEPEETNCVKYSKALLSRPNINFEMNKIWVFDVFLCHSNCTVFL